jgi:epoxyqueuosine reductase
MIDPPLSAAPPPAAPADAASADPAHPNWATLAAQIRRWGRELGFQAVAISEAQLGEAMQGLHAWLAQGFHGEMAYMARQAGLRADPGALLPERPADLPLRVISARMDYLPEAAPASGILAEGGRAYIARYALGRDYHKLMRRRLAELARRIQASLAAPLAWRVCTDSAPVLEVELARQAGLGWRGKHTLLLSREAGSYFFLGEIVLALPLPADRPLGAREGRCGSCSRCLPACPTGAIVAPYRLDARRCISYLTIELKGSIPEPLRAPIGNRVYGCDDCQLACPWNRFARVSAEADFRVRHGLDAAQLVDLFAWDEATFLTRTEGSAIRRIGHERWLRNLAVGLGNAPASPEARSALEARADHPSALVREHVAWARARHAARQG